MRRLLHEWARAFRREWEHEDSLRMRAIAHRYAERAIMDGTVIKKTGEIVPKESV